MRILAFVALAPLLLGAAPAPPPPRADLMLWGGPVYTGVDAHPAAQAVGVSRGRIVFVGRRAEAQRWVGPRTQVVDLHGAALFPGFTDSHAHLRGIGERELTLNLEGSKSAAEVRERLAAYAAKAPAGSTIVGRGWIETGWPEKRFLNAADLDAVAPGRVVLLSRADGHALTVSSAALKAAGIDARTPDPFGGRIDKDASGRPTGMLVDNAMGLVGRLQKPPTEAERLAAFRAAFRVEAAYGWTGVHSMSVSWPDVPLLEAMAARGEAPLRVYNAVDVGEAGALLASGPRSSPGGRIVTRAIKIYADGALGSRGAALFEPYADAPETRGLLKLKPEDTAPVLARALKAGVQVATHAIGDRGNDVVLNLYRDAGVRPGAGSPRWRIEHAQNLTDADIPRFRELGVIASMQPSHAIGDLRFAGARLGMDRLRGAYAWKRLEDAGAVVVGGSDAPVERGDPLIEFYAAVARRDLQGRSGPGWHPEQALSREQALKLFTASAAYARFAEAELGTLEVGKRADLTAFSVDLMRAPVEAIPKGKAVLTVVDGEVVFSAPDVVRR